MNEIVYISGFIADAIGGKHIQEIADTLATLTREPVDVLTHGTSEHHSRVRYVGKVGER